MRNHTSTASIDTPDNLGAIINSLRIAMCDMPAQAADFVIPATVGSQTSANNRPQGGHHKAYGENRVYTGRATCDPKLSPPSRDGLVAQRPSSSAMDIASISMRGF
ncbi:hypothetical protein [Calycomorphotria hydatis]|uniref:hypothetical protein n=1 Tax=Calycomorphotria hydatis TaxID=2528027 RepID=UPI0011A8B3F1|nr:hypothetical protein [Calycomorphotria hydatis]